MYYVTNYYTGEIIDIFEHVEQAIEFSKTVLDSKVFDENDNFYYCNVDIPF